MPELISSCAIILAQVSAVDQTDPGVLDIVQKIVATGASLATVASVAFSIFLHLTVQRLNRESVRRIWSNIASTKALLRHLERAAENEEPDVDAIHQAYGLASEHFRRLLAEASLVERNYSIDTIRLWRRTGKISSDWQERQAYMLLSTPEIDTTKADTLPESFGSFDQPSSDHRVAKQCVGLAKPASCDPSEI